MVYRRRRFTRKRRTNNRNYRRRFRRTRTTRYKGGQKRFLYKRFTGVFGSLQLNNISETYAGYNFSLSDLPNYTEFTALYDMYKINRVKISFLPQQTISNSLSTVSNAAAYARFFSVIDTNDATAPTSIDQLREYESCKYTTIHRRHKRYFKPRITDSGNVYTPGNPWIATSSPNVNYFGLKVAAEAIDSTVSTTMDYTIECKYYLSFRNVK